MRYKSKRMETNPERRRQRAKANDKYAVVDFSIGGFFIMHDSGAESGEPEVSERTKAALERFKIRNEGNG